MKTRGFEIAKGWEDKNIILPRRSTKSSAGYDIAAAETMTIKPFKNGDMPSLIPTGLKVYMLNDEYLMLANRSSGPKKGICFPHSFGIIDSDYYGNENNDGLLYVQIFNLKNEDLIINKGDIIAQGIFMKYLLVDNDNANGTRTNGFGSTDKND